MLHTNHHVGLFANPFSYLIILAMLHFWLHIHVYLHVGIPRYLSHPDAGIEHLRADSRVTRRGRIAVQLISAKRVYTDASRVLPHGSIRLCEGGKKRKVREKTCFMSHKNKISLLFLLFDLNYYQGM